MEERANPPSQLPEGLGLTPGYLSAEDEAKLVAAIDALPWNTDWARRRQLYGVRYDQTPSAPFPPFLVSLVERLSSEGFLPSRPINSVVNEYLPGQGIALHLDRPGFGEPVVSLSLLSAVKMQFRPSATGPRRGRPVEVDLPQRSLLRLSGDARWRWLHGIAARQSDVIGGLVRSRGRRISVTLRCENLKEPARQPVGPRKRFGVEQSPRG